MGDTGADFWAMGGYAQYVWPAYVVALGTIVLTAWSAHRALREALDKARRAAQEMEESP